MGPKKIWHDKATLDHDIFHQRWPPKTREPCPGSNGSFTLFTQRWAPKTSRQGQTLMGPIHTSPRGGHQNKQAEQKQLKGPMHFSLEVGTKNSSNHKLCGVFFNCHSLPLDFLLTFLYLIWYGFISDTPPSLPAKPLQPITMSSEIKI